MKLDVTESGTIRIKEVIKLLKEHSKHYKKLQQIESNVNNVIRFILLDKLIEMFETGEEREPGDLS